MIKKTLLLIFTFLILWMPTQVMTMNNNKANNFIQLSIYDIKNVGNTKIVKIQLINTKNKQPITLKDLKEVHTEKIHLLIIDDSLEDYAHLHPMPTSTPGVYEFEWKPQKKDANYRIFADMLPLATNVKEYNIADLIKTNNKPNINQTVFLQSKLDNLIFTLSFENPELTKNETIVGKINITNEKGEPVKNLEPIMGSFAHIVGFNENFKDVVHIHPIGKEPDHSTDQGGPAFEFHMETKEAGYIKLFVQVKIKGKILYVPFGIMIKP